jgi:hypothetical protein
MMADVFGLQYWSRSRRLEAYRSFANFANRQVMEGFLAWRMLLLQKRISKSYKWTQVLVLTRSSISSRRI